MKITYRSLSFYFSEHSDRLLESCGGFFLIDDKILVMGSTTFGSVVSLRRLSTVSYVYDSDITATQWTWYWMDKHGYWKEYGFDDMVSCYLILHQEKRQRLYDHCSQDNKFSEALCSQIMESRLFASCWNLTFFKNVTLQYQKTSGSKKIQPVSI